MHFAFEKLARKIMLLGWSQNDVVDQIVKRFGRGEAMSQATVSHVLTGKNQHPPTVKKVADVLGVEMEDLLTEPLSQDSLSRESKRPKRRKSA
jgi:transcriptional regulator with XRE-family HTH domain